jgi:hypothetical protein
VTGKQTVTSPPWVSVRQALASPLLSPGTQEWPMSTTVTATAATTGTQRQPATAQYSRTIRANWRYVRPEKRKLNLYGASPPRHAASQISRTGRWPPGKSSRRV